MKRSPLIIGISLFIGLCVCLILKDGHVLILAGVLFAVSLVLLLFKNMRQSPVYSVVLISMSFGIVMCNFYYNSAVEPGMTYGGKTCSVSGTIFEYPRSENEKTYYILKNVYIDGNKISGKVRVTSSGYLNISVDDRLSGDMFLYNPSVNKNYYFSEKIYLFASLSDLRSAKIEKNYTHSLMYYPLFVREKIKDAIMHYEKCDETALMSAVITGDRRDISEKVISDFRTVGISHMLAVSGLNLTVLVSFISIFLKKLGASKKVSAILCIPAIIFFCAVTGFQASVVRSAVMCIILITADIFKRKADALNSLGAAIMIICILNPLSPFDIGFMLSASATFGLICVDPIIGPKIRKFLKADNIKHMKKLFDYFISVFSCSISATITTLPFSAFYFGKISLIAPLANIVLMFPFTVIFLLAVIVAALFYIPMITVVSRLFYFIDFYITKIFIYVLSSLSGIPGIYANFSSFYIKLWFALVCFIGALYLIIENKKFRKTAVCVCTCALVASVVVSYIDSMSSSEIIVSDCGSSVSVIVKQGSEAAVIGTEPYDIKDTLKKYDISSVCSIGVLRSSYKSYNNAMILADEYNVSHINFPNEFYIDGATEIRAKNYKAENNFTTLSKFNIYYYPLGDSGQSCCVIETCGKKILICEKGADLSTIDLDLDLLITSSAPKNLNENCRQKYVISSYADKTDKIVKELCFNGGEYISTGGSGNLIINVNSGDLKVRRDNNA